MKKLPDTALLYWSADDTPCLLAFRSLDEIPTDEDGAIVGRYKLESSNTFKVQALLEPKAKKRRT